MNSGQLYKNKYLKYKSKYLSIQKGGTHKVTIKYSFYDNKIRSLDTDFSKIEFYNKFDPENKSTFAILNGANVNLDGNGIGTTGAINTLNKKFFIHSNISEIFNPMNPPFEYIDHISNEMKTIINDPSQQIKYKTQKYSACSVFNSYDNDHNKVKLIYHIKGVDLRLVNKKKIEPKIQTIIEMYYLIILNDFNEEKPLYPNLDIIYMPIIPGDIFGGTEITEITLIETVLKFIKNTDIKRSFTIILGLNPKIYEDLYRQQFLNAQSKTSLSIANTPILKTETHINNKITVIITDSPIDITNSKFYLKYNPDRKSNFALLNECNKHLSSEGSISKINNSFFNHTNITVLFSPTNDYSSYSELMDSPQNIIVDKIFYPAGSVFKVTKEPNNFPVSCVYHIKGVDIKLGNVTEKMTEIISAYYKKILMDFYFDRKEEYIYMIPIPGGKFTENLLYELVKDFIKEREGQLQRSFTIILLNSSIKKNRCRKN
jgi:hypothetical protein